MPFTLFMLPFRSGHEGLGLGHSGMYRMMRVRKDDEGVDDNDNEINDYSEAEETTKRYFDPNREALKQMYRKYMQWITNRQNNHMKH